MCSVHAARLASKKHHLAPRSPITMCRKEALASLRAADNALDAAYQFYMDHMDSPGGAAAAWAGKAGTGGDAALVSVLLGATGPA
jgi:hypothetical protein